MCSKFFINNETLEIRESADLYDFLELKKLILQNKKLKTIQVKAKVDANITYMLTIAERRGIQVLGYDRSSSLWDKLKHIEDVKKANFRPGPYNIFSNIEILRFHDILFADGLQRRFWLKTFRSFSYNFIIENAFISFFLFGLFGLGVMYIIFSKLVMYNLQFDSPKAIYYTTLKVVSPTVGAVFIICKLATATCSLIKLKNISGEFKTMRMMNLDPKKTYLPPIVLSFGVAGLMLNFFSICVLFAGSSVGWWFVANRYPTSFFQELLPVWNFTDIFYTLVTGVLCGFWTGYVTCACGLHPSKSVESVVDSVSECVFFSVIGVSTIQVIVTLFFGQKFIN